MKDEILNKDGKKIKRKRETLLLLGGALVVFVLAMAYCIWIKMGRENVLINSLVFLFMFFAICLGVRPMGKLPGLRRLERAIYVMCLAEIRAQRRTSDRMALVEELIDLAQDNHCPELGQALENHKKACQNTEGNSDLTKFFNEELIDKIANVRINNLVGSTLTGLGILGTFVGLMVGLKSFTLPAMASDAEAAVAAVADMNILMQGIQTAFLTSVVGISGSLLYNAFYHGLMNQAHDKMEALLEQCGKGGRLSVDCEEIVVWNLRAQTHNLKTQTEILENLGKQIVEELARSVPPAIAEGINEAVKPQMEDLINRVAEVYQQNMEKIAADFLVEVNKMLQSELAVSRQSIQELTRQRQNFGETVQKMTRQISSAENRMGGFCEALGKNVRLLEECEEKLQRMRDEWPAQQKELLDAINARNKEVCAGQKATQEKLDAIARVAEETGKNLRQNLDEIDKNQEAILTIQREMTGILKQSSASETEKWKCLQKALDQAISQPLRKSLAAIQTEVGKTQDVLDAVGLQTVEAITELQTIVQKIEEETLTKADIASLVDGLSGLEQSINEELAEISSKIGKVQAGVDKVGNSEADKLDRLQNTLMCLREDVRTLDPYLQSLRELEIWIRNDEAGQTQEQAERNTPQPETDTTAGALSYS